MKMTTQTARNIKATAPNVRSSIWRWLEPESEPSESPKRPVGKRPEDVDLIEAWKTKQNGEQLNFWLNIKKNSLKAPLDGCQDSLLDSPLASILRNATNTE